MHFDINTAPTDEALDYLSMCIENATEAGDTIACARFEIMVWAFKLELATGIFPLEEMNTKLAILIN